MIETGIKKIPSIYVTKKYRIGIKGISHETPHPAISILVGNYGNRTGILVAILRDGSDHDAGGMDFRQADAPGGESGNHEVRP